LGYHARICFKCKCRLGLFDNIIPCGIRGKAVTSLNVELGVEKVNEDEVKEKILNHLTGCLRAKLKRIVKNQHDLQSLPSVVFLNELYISKTE
jgi:lipoate-protein ligase B